MRGVSSSQLKRIVEAKHGGKATFVELVPVCESLGDDSFWEGIVHVFDLEGDTLATRAYAWSSPHDDGTRRFFSVLHAPPISSPGDAVKTTLASERSDKS